MRKIVHVDMDAFYASVEQRDDPALRGKPVVVAWRGARSVVCAASYEARRFGVRSAMPALRAERLCPQAIFVAPDFARYRAVSRQVREIFLRHTEHVEPLSLDEAYLDVTEPRSRLDSATAIAQAIRRAIAQETALTASAGVAPNKFLAKIASDWNKPDGLFVIRPHQVGAFLAPLPVSRLPGVGRVMDARLAALGIRTCADLRLRQVQDLQARFGRFGTRLHELARGVDERAVHADQAVQSISTEDTLERDQPLYALQHVIAALAARTWQAARKVDRIGRTVVLKLKTADFHVLTRSHTAPLPPLSETEFVAIAAHLTERVQMPQTTLYRLVGIGLCNFRDAQEFTQPELFPA